jgi:predicted transposase/invertase (TIGR01784 family)
MRFFAIIAMLSSNIWSVTSLDLEQTFCRPTRDSVFKHVLSDERIRNSFINALSPFKGVHSSNLMATDLRPLAVDENLLNILNNREFQLFVNGTQHLELSSATLKSMSEMPAVSGELESARKEHRALSLCQRFFAAFRKEWGNIRSKLCDDKKGVCDIVSRLDSGDIVLVEAQVLKKDCLDKRFLLYSTTLYSNQLRKTQDWSELKNVASVILIAHDVALSLGWSAKEYKRHYLLTNKLAESDDCKGTNTWPYLQLILYCLPRVGKVNIEEPLEKSWLEFFNSAHTLDDIPETTPLEVVAAYDRVRRNNLPLSVTKEMETEDDCLRNMAGVLKDEWQSGRLHGHQEGRLQGHQEGHLQGHQEGHLQGRLSLLTKLLESHTITKEIHDSEVAALRSTPAGPEAGGGA